MDCDVDLVWRVVGVLVGVGGVGGCFIFGEGELLGGCIRQIFSLVFFCLKLELLNQADLLFI